MADSKSSYEEDSSNEAADEAPTGEKRKLVEDSESNEEDDGGGGDTEKEMKKQKIGFQIGRIGVWKQGENSINTIKKNPTPISIKLGAQKPKENPSVLKATSASVAKAFNPEEDDDDEEMPPEAKMRMRNIGRDTPTSAGPNSFGKTRQGFCDTKKMFERQIKKKLEETSD